MCCDFARGKLGGGFVIERRADQPLKPILKVVADELIEQPPRPRDQPEFRFRRSDRLRPRSDRANVLEPSRKCPDARSLGKADPRGGNCGRRKIQAFRRQWREADPAGVMKQLFMPFTRGDAHFTKQGLGLGLFIASEIAKAHQGTLTVASSPEETRFTFRMPLH